MFYIYALIAILSIALGLFYSHSDTILMGLIWGVMAKIEALKEK